MNWPIASVPCAVTVSRLDDCSGFALYIQTFATVMMGGV